MSIPAATTARSSHDGHGRVEAKGQQEGQTDKQGNPIWTFVCAFCLRFVCGLLCGWSKTRAGAAG